MEWRGGTRQRKAHGQIPTSWSHEFWLWPGASIVTMLVNSFCFPHPAKRSDIKDTFPCGAGFYQFWSLNTSRVHIHVDQMQSKFLKYLFIRIDDGCRKWNNVGQRSVMERCVTYTATIERLRDRLQGPGTLYDVDVCFGVRRLFSGAL